MDVDFNDTWTEYELVGILRSWQRITAQLRERTPLRKQIIIRRVRERHSARN